MEIAGEKIVTAVAASLITGLLQPVMPETITDIEPFTLLNTPSVQFVLTLVLLYSLLSWLVGLIRARVGDTGGPRSVAIGSTTRSKPRRDVSEWGVKKFGVKWRALHGRRRSLGEPYAYTESAVCPECETDLMTDTKR
jgi:hypothetical protein